MNPFVGLSKVTRKRLDALEHMDQGFEDLKTRIEELEKNPRTVITQQVPGGTAVPTAATPEQNDNVFYGNIDGIIDNAIKYVTQEKEIDEIIGQFIEDLKINKTINKK
jgi:hypothetical protein